MNLIGKFLPEEISGKIDFYRENAPKVWAHGFIVLGPDIYKISDEGPDWYEVTSRIGARWRLNKQQVNQFYEAHTECWG